MRICWLGISPHTNTHTAKFHMALLSVKIAKNNNNGNYNNNRCSKLREKVNELRLRVGTKRAREQLYLSNNNCCCVCACVFVCGRHVTLTMTSNHPQLLYWLPALAATLTLTATLHFFEAIFAFADVTSNKMLLLKLPMLLLLLIVVSWLLVKLLVVVPTKGALTIFSTFYKKNVRNQKDATALSLSVYVSICIWASVYMRRPQKFTGKAT